MIQLKTIAYGVACMLSVSAAYAAVDDARVFGKAALAAKASPVQKSATQASPVNLPALSVDQIVERNITARGGLAAWQKVQSISFVGRIDAGKTRKDGGSIAMMGSPQGRAAARAEFRAALASKGETPENKTIQLPFRMELKRPLMSRLEIPFQGDTAVQVYDGVQGWKLRPFLGRHEVEPFTPEELKIAALQQELDGPLMNYAAKGTRVTLDGNERVDGHDCYRLKLTLKSGDVRRVWIDAQSFLDVRSEGAPRQWDGKLRPVLTYFRDFKTVDGLKIPYVLETTIEGVRGSENIIVEQVALNSVADNTRFKKPL